MLLRFTKMHGLGNDFVVLDLVTQHFVVKKHHIRKIADRNFGIGCDQVLLVEPPTRPDVDFRYRIFNQDGDEVEQCGNGARCFARFVREHRLTGKTQIRVETNTGLITLELVEGNQVRVDMGVPRFDPADLPFTADREQSQYSLDVNGRDLSIAAVSMGNPHAVLSVDDVDHCELESLGPVIESHTRFPNRVNAGFCQTLNPNHIRLRVFERGVGETLACGTGACAAVVCGIDQGHLQSPVQVDLPGGALRIEWQGRGTPVIMTGPANTVFEGQISL